MAVGNADVVRPIYEHWGRGDWTPLFDVYHPEMEWGWSDEFPRLSGWAFFEQGGRRPRGVAALQ